MRNITKKIRIGDRFIGGGEPILIQSMTNTKTQDIKGTVEQIKLLEDVGCQIVRTAVPDMEAAAAVSEIKKQISIPLLADINFNYRLNIASIKNGADKIRINPGNIGGQERLKAVVETAKQYEVPIRIGVNSGSLEKELLAKYGRPTADALVESALNSVKLVENMGFEDIVVSIKSTDVMLTIESYLKMSKVSCYPLHLGITEAGTKLSGSVKSSVGLGIILYNGVGDTLRVSLTGDPVDEVYAAREILRSLKLLQGGIEVVSCPTCGRTNVDLVKIAERIEERTRRLKVKKPMKVAVMGCAVNGPGEAREADIGIAGGKGEFLLFVKGEIIRKIPQQNAIEEFIKEIEKFQEGNN